MWETWLCSKASITFLFQLPWGSPASPCPPPNTPCCYLTPMLDAALRDHVVLDWLLQRPKTQCPSCPSLLCHGDAQLQTIATLGMPRVYWAKMGGKPGSGMGWQKGGSERERLAPVRLPPGSCQWRVLGLVNTAG